MKNEVHCVFEVFDGECVFRLVKIFANLEDAIRYKNKLEKDAKCTRYYVMPETIY